MTVHRPYAHTPQRSGTQTSSTLLFVSAASNEVGVAGGRALVDAFDASQSLVQLDVSFNPRIAYKDITRARLTNALRGGSSAVNPLDGLSKGEADATNF